MSIQQFKTPAKVLGLAFSMALHPRGSRKAKR